MYDVFISHASEDKHSVAKPIAEHLTRNGLKVWFDDQQLLIGDRLLEKITSALQTSNYGVVVLSQNFFLKKWPRYELSQLSMNRILPIRHRISHAELVEHAPGLSELRILSTSDGLNRICNEIIQVVQ